MVNISRPSLLVAAWACASHPLRHKPCCGFVTLRTDNLTSLYYPTVNPSLLFGDFLISRCSEIGLLHFNGLVNHKVRDHLTLLGLSCILIFASQLSAMYLGIKVAPAMRPDMPWTPSRDTRLCLGLLFNRLYAMLPAPFHTLLSILEHVCCLPFVLKVSQGDQVPVAQARLHEGAHALQRAWAERVVASSGIAAAAPGRSESAGCRRRRRSGCWCRDSSKSLSELATLLRLSTEMVVILFLNLPPVRQMTGGCTVGAGDVHTPCADQSGAGAQEAERRSHRSLSQARNALRSACRTFRSSTSCSARRGSCRAPGSLARTSGTACPSAAWRSALR